MRENTDQNNSEYGHFLRSLCQSLIFNKVEGLSLRDCLYLRHTFYKKELHKGNFMLVKVKEMHNLLKNPTIASN